MTCGIMRRTPSSTSGHPRECGSTTPANTPARAPWSYADSQPTCPTQTTLEIGVQHPRPPARIRPSATLGPHRGGACREPDAVHPQRAHRKRPVKWASDQTAPPMPTQEPEDDPAVLAVSAVSSAPESLNGSPARATLPTAERNGPHQLRGSTPDRSNTTKLRLAEGVDRRRQVCPRQRKRQSVGQFLHA